MKLTGSEEFSSTLAELYNVELKRNPDAAPLTVAIAVLGGEIFGVLRKHERLAARVEQLEGEVRALKQVAK